MKRTSLGRTGVSVSKLCFGTMSFGGDATEDEAAEMYAACRDAGINFFDCANVYNKGESEKILGRLVKSHRDEIVLTSKCVQQMGSDPNGAGASRRHIRLAVEASLRRLGTDRLDVLFMHAFDDTVPLEETLRAIDDLIAAGKVVYAGASNYAAWQVAKALGISERRGFARFDVLQPMYNLVKRQAEVEILALAQAEGLGVISYSPVGGGLLSGKYGSGKRPDVGRIVSNQMYAGRYSQDWVFEVAEKFTAFADENGFHPVSLAVAWVGAHPGITAPIIGARNVDQLQPSLDSVHIEMTPELYAAVSALSPKPAPAHDRSEEA